MDYSDFVEAMREEVEKLIDEEMRVDVHSATKNNGTEREGLVIIRTGINISPTIYLEEFYDQYLDGNEIPDLAQSVLRLYEKIKVEHPFPCENILNYEMIKDRIAYKLINKEWNSELLRQIPYVDYLDLAIVFYLMLDNSEFGNATILLRNEHIQGWHVSAEELFATASENTEKIFPPALDRMTDFMYVLSNKSRTLGAAAVLYEGIFDKICEVVGERYFVLPSSIHELIIIPEDYGIDREHLEMMVREINETEVDREERLSNRVYYYDGCELR